MLKMVPVRPVMYLVIPSSAAGGNTSFNQSVITVMLMRLFKALT